MSDETFAFVLMPFAALFDDVYRLGIKEPAEGLGMRAERVDEQIYAGSISERISRQIDAADIIIADMSGQNPNVFYEVGYAHAKEKLCILLTNRAADIPFDLKHRRHIVYDSIQALREQLTKHLMWAKSELDNVRKNRIRVQVKSVGGMLELTKWHATVSLDFVIDLHNDFDVASAEIESIYLYTAHEWETYQGDVISPTTESDLPRFKYRHFLTSPVKRLQRSAWAQLKFRAKRVVASKLRGEELPEKYPIKGRAGLRLVTDRGFFDYSIPIDTTAEDIPF